MDLSEDWPPRLLRLLRLLLDVLQEIRVFHTPGIYVHQHVLGLLGTGIALQKTIDPCFWVLCRHVFGQTILHPSFTVLYYLPHLLKQQRMEFFIYAQISNCSQFHTVKKVWLHFSELLKSILAIIIDRCARNRLHFPEDVVETMLPFLIFACIASQVIPSFPIQIFVRIVETNIPSRTHWLLAQAGRRRLSL